MICCSCSRDTSHPQLQWKSETCPILMRFDGCCQIDCRLSRSTFLAKNWCVFGWKWEKNTKTTKYIFVWKWNWLIPVIKVLIFSTKNENEIWSVGKSAQLTVDFIFCSRYECLLMKCFTGFNICDISVIFLVLSTRLMYISQHLVQKTCHKKMIYSWVVTKFCWRVLEWDFVIWVE